MSEVKRPKKTLLIGWDGADWEHISPLLDEGLLPNLSRLIEQGVMGNLATLQPVLSPMLWTSMATGKLADKHGIHGFMEPEPSGEGGRPFTSLSRKCKAFWNIFSQEGMRGNVVSWWASHPTESINGHFVSNMYNQTRRNPLRYPEKCIHPEERARELADYKITNAEIEIEDILPFVPKLGEIDLKKDNRVQGLVKILSENASLHALTTALMQEEDWDYTALYLDGIDHFCHGFVQYHPPQMSNVPEKDFELYKEVIRMAYRFHDSMLGQLLALAGPEALVILCSDHGFQSGAMRPLGTPREPAGPAAWHRDLGIIVMSGPGIKKDERVTGANIIDLTPTLLAALNLPVGEDMDGRVLYDAFEKYPEVKTIPSWEDVPGEHEGGMHPPGTELDSATTRELTKHFVALGYVEDHGADAKKAHLASQIECYYNLARVYYSSRRFAEALPYFEKLVNLSPWEERFIQYLVFTLNRLARYKQAGEVLTKAYPDPAFLPISLRIGQAYIILRTEGKEEAQEYIDEHLAGLELSSPPLLRRLAALYVDLRHYEAAEQALTHALGVDPDDYTALCELARLRLIQRDWLEASELALKSISKLYHQPVAHYILGRALLHLKKNKEAVHAFELALKMRPGLYRARRSLQRLYASREMDKPDMAALHGAEAAKLRQRKQQKGEPAPALQLPDFPSPEERREYLLKERETPGEREARRGSSGRTFIIVSGLPRSGTSLMMQMLAKAGLPAQTDQERRPDEDNPEGYYEWEAIKETSKLPELFETTEGLEQRALKVTSPLLPALPIEHNYKIIFMLRPPREIAASQQKMVERRGTESPKDQLDELAATLLDHRLETLQKLRRSKNFDLLEIPYPRLIAEPEEQCSKIIEFLGSNLTAPEKLSEAINPSLYRQKLNPASEASQKVE